MCLALVHTTRSAGFTHDDSAQQGQGGEKPAPNPTRQVLTRRVGEPIDLIQVLMIELVEQRWDGALDVGEIPAPRSAPAQHRAGERPVSARRRPGGSGPPPPWG